MLFPARLLLVCLASLTLVAPLCSAAGLRLVGSDLLREALSPAIEEFSRNNELPVQVSLEGSGVGIENLLQGRAELGLIAFGPGDARPRDPYVVLPVAYFTAVFVMRESIPITQLNYRQLASIFGEGEGATFRRWGELGVSGPWSARSISAVVSGQEGAMALNLFRHLALRTPQLQVHVHMLDTPAEAQARVSGDEGGIALLPLPPEDLGMLKTLLVAGGDRNVAYGPTPENVHSGDYPLRLPLNLVFHKSDLAQLQPLLRHLLSEEMLPAWRKAGVMALPIQARNQQIFDLETL